MLRGSKPGERRGGRKRATPNKRTVLTDRILSIGLEHPRSLEPRGSCLSWSRTQSCQRISGWRWRRKAFRSSGCGNLGLAGQEQEGAI